MTTLKIHYSIKIEPVFGLVDVVCTQVVKEVYQATKNKTKVTCKRCKKLIKAE